MGNNIKENIRAFRESVENKNLTPVEVNKKLLQKFEKIISADGNRMLIMSADIAGIRGRICLYVRTDGTVRKAVSEDICHSLNIRPSDHYIMAEGSKFFLYEELGITANSKGYRAVKLPYAGAAWQPYKHVLVAYAFGLLDNLSFYDDYVVNHIASRYQGDGLGNLEIVTQSENTACGKFVKRVMDENSSITYMSLSAKKANVLKYFRAPIRELVSRIGEMPTQVGSEFVINNIKYEFTPENIRINCRLMYKNEYDNHMLIVIRRDLYENS